MQNINPRREDYNGISKENRRSLGHAPADHALCRPTCRNNGAGSKAHP